MATRTDSPKVFISYSWSSIPHQNWVLEFADRLMNDGVTVILDKWDLKEGQDKFIFMEQMVNNPEITRVLIICDKIYKEKANQREGGAGTETEIISSEIYNNVAQEKFIPVIREYEDGEPCKPTYLESRMHFDLSDDTKFHSEYEKILRNIFERPTHKRPVLGIPPAHLFEDQPAQSQTGKKAQTFIEAFTNERPAAKSLFTEYLTGLKLGFEECRLTSADSDVEIDDQVLASIERFIPYRNEFVEIVYRLCDKKETLDYFYKIHDFFTWTIAFINPTLSVASSPGLDACRFVANELFLYMMAVLINEQHLDAIRLFLEEEYLITTIGHGKVEETFNVFNPSLDTLNRYRKQRLNLKLISVQTDILVERANVSSVTLEQIIQADFVLFMQDLLNPKSRYSRWYPRTLIYVFSITPPLDLFHKARGERHYKFLKSLLKIRDIEDLINRLNQAEYHKALGETFWRSSMSLDRLLNLPDLLSLHNPDSPLLKNAS